MSISPLRFGETIVQRSPEPNTAEFLKTQSILQAYNQASDGYFRSGEENRQLMSGDRFHQTAKEEAKTVLQDTATVMRYGSPAQMVNWLGHMADKGGYDFTPYDGTKLQAALELYQHYINAAITWARDSLKESGKVVAYPSQYFNTASLYQQQLAKLFQTPAA